MWWDSDRATIQAGECYRNVEALRQLRFAQLTGQFFLWLDCGGATWKAEMSRKNVTFVTVDLESCAM